MCEIRKTTLSKKSTKNKTICFCNIFLKRFIFREITIRIFPKRGKEEREMKNFWWLYHENIRLFTRDYPKQIRKFSTFWKFQKTSNFKIWKCLLVKTKEIYDSSKRAYFPSFRGFSTMHIPRQLLQSTKVIKVLNCI